LLLLLVFKLGQLHVLLIPVQQLQLVHLQSLLALQLVIPSMLQDHMVDKHLQLIVIYVTLSKLLVQVSLLLLHLIPLVQLHVLLVPAHLLQLVQFPLLPAHQIM
jgi:hypothetical protein